MSCPLGKEHVCCTQISNLCVTHGSTSILENISFHLHCDELTALIGKNGAGKTTFLKALLGVIPHTGTIFFEGENKKQTTHPRFGYVPQQLALETESPVSVEDLVCASFSNYPVWLARRKKDAERAKEILRVVHAENLSSRRIGDLSGGELQRVMLALALNPLPDILLLDEPISGVDKNGRELFYELVSSLRKNYDITILLVSHDFDLIARYADKVLLIDKTLEAEGSANEVFHSSAFQKIFGDSFQGEKNE